MYRYLVDASYVIALVNPDDDDHERAIELMSKHDRSHLVVTDSVLFEVGNGLSRKFKQEAVAIIQDFLSSNQVEFVRTTPDLFDKAFSMYSEYPDKEWGLVDCISFQVMHDRGMKEALTADHHFTQAGFVALMRP